MVKKEEKKDTFVEEDLRNYTNFPLSDVLAIIIDMMGRVQTRAEAGGDNDVAALIETVDAIRRGEDIGDPAQYLVPMSIVLPVPLPSVYVEQLKEMEAEIIANPENVSICQNCQKGSDRSCPGVMKEGDLFRCILSSIMKLGLETIQELLGRMHAEQALYETTTAEKMFKNYQLH